MPGGTGTGRAQDATLQKMLAALGGPFGGTNGSGTGDAQDASLQQILTALTGGGGGAKNPFAIVNAVTVFGIDNTGATDVGPGLTSALATTAANGQILWLPPGTYKVATVITLPPHGRLWGSGTDLTYITSTIAAGPPLNCTFLGTNVYGAAGTIAATPTLYSDQVTSTTSVAPFSWIQLLSAVASHPIAYVQTFQVIAKTGGPTFTYTLDRSLARPFVMGDVFQAVTTILEGCELGFFTISGTGTRALDTVGSVRCWFHDIVIDGSSGNYFGEGGSFDTGGFDNEWCRVKVIGPGGGVVNHGLLHESGDRARTIDCRTDGCNTGQVLWDTVNGEIRNPSGSNCINMVSVDGDSALTVGSLNCTVTGGGGVNNTTDYAVGRATGTSIVAPSSLGAQLSGVAIGGVNTTTGRAFDTQIVGGIIKDANIIQQVTTGGGITLVNCQGVTIEGVSIEGPYAAGVSISGTAVTDVAGDVGTIHNVIAAGGRQAGILQACVGATGKIVGMLVDTAAYGVYYDTGGTFSRFIVDEMCGQNLATGQVANPADGIFNGVFYKPSGATSVDVRDVRTVIHADAGATTVTQPMLNAVDGQAVDNEDRTGNTTINRANAYLAGGANWTGASTAAGAATLGLIYQAALVAAIERYRTNTNS